MNVDSDSEYSGGEKGSDDEADDDRATEAFFNDEDAGARADGDKAEAGFDDDFFNVCIRSSAPHVQSFFYSRNVG